MPGTDRWLDTFRQLHRRIALNGEKRLSEWLLFFLLLPFSIIYGLIGLLRIICYDRKIFASYKSPVPVVSVGNLAVGGTGKTPVVDWLLKEFLRQGKLPAVVSRGYGGTFRGEFGIVCKGQGVLLDSVVAGDEPYLLARRNPQVVTLIARKRAAGIRAAVERFGADVIILDDGFQHRAVRRDLDLVLLDATSPFGNRWPLPAGLLREFPFALRRADIFLLTRAQEDSCFQFADKPVFISRHQLADHAIDLNGERAGFAELRSGKFCAFAGIADPKSFFSALINAGLSLEECLPLGDHCSYDQKTLQRILAMADDCDGLLTTEKDAVKLSPDMFSIPCYQVPMTIIIDDDDNFRKQVRNRLWSEV